MASVASALAYIFGNEGGYANRKADKGGPTKYGITWKTLARARKLRPDAGYPADVKDLTIEQAADIYERDYVPDGFGDIKDQRLGTLLMDMGVLSGPAEAGTLMQRALCAVGQGVVVDGNVGPKTIAAMNAADPDALIGAYRQQRIQFFHHLVDKDPTQAENLNGWINRANKVPPMEA